MQSTQYAVVKHAAVKITAEQALATIREVKIAVDGVLQVVGGLVRPMNGLLDALLNQIQTIVLPSVAFTETEGKLTDHQYRPQSGFLWYFPERRLSDTIQK